VNDVSGFEQQFATSDDTVADARANLRNAAAAVLWVAMLILLAVSPALVIHVWRWAL